MLAFNNVALFIGKKSVAKEYSFSSDKKWCFICPHKMQVVGHNDSGSVLIYESSLPLSKSNIKCNAFIFIGVHWKVVPKILFRRASQFFTIFMPSPIY